MSPLSSLLALGTLLAAAPLIPGVAARTKAVLTGRRGAPVWQLYADLWRLAGKGAVYSHTATWVFRLAPVAIFGTTLLAGLLVPLDGQRGLVSFSGDGIAFVYLLGLGRYLLVLGALDTGSSFEGMGASRAVTFASFVEPGLLVSLVALSIATGSLSLTGMLGVPLWQHGAGIAPTIVLLGASVFVLLLAECARVPVDDPLTHLELTMIDEVMLLDHSGPDLALLLYGNALKLGVFTALVVGLLPRGELPAWGASALLLVGLLAGGVAVGVVESTMARLRLPKVPLFIASGTALGLCGLILLLR